MVSKPRRKQTPSCFAAAPRSLLLVERPITDKRLKLTARQQLQNLTDALVEDIMSMSEEEILAETTEKGVDIEAEVEKFRQMLENIRSKMDLQK